MISDFYRYGEALKELISKVFKGSIIYEPSDTAFEYALNATKNNIKFPLISFYHQNDIELDRSRNSFGAYRRGVLMENSVPVRDENMKLTGETNKKISKSVQNLYITMKYIFDVYGTDRLSTERATQELLFWLFENQQIEIKYQGHTLNMTFEISPNIVDNTDLASYHSNGKLYRYSIAISSHIALFRSVDYFNVINPEITVGTEEK